MDGQRRLENKEEIINHIEDYFASLYADEGWERPSLDNIAFDVIGAQWAQWLERKFEEEEVHQAVFDLEGDKAPDPDGFPLAFLRHFMGDAKGGYPSLHGGIPSKGKDL